MTESSSLSLSDIEQGAQRTLADMLALNPANYRVLNVDIAQSVDMVLANLDEIEALWPRFEKLPEFDFDAVKKMRDRCKALLLANAKCTAPAVDLHELAELDKAVTKLRQILEAEARTLILRDVLDPTALDGQRGANGYRNNAQDLLAIASQLRDNFDKIQEAKLRSKASWSVTKEELTTAMDQAYALEEMAAKRDQGPEATAENYDLRARSYTLFMHSYDEVRRGVDYYFSRTGDAEKIAPSLYGGRARVKAVSPPAPTPAPVVTPTLVATPEEKKVPVGAQGGSPFEG